MKETADGDATDPLMSGSGPSALTGKRQIVERGGYLAGVSFIRPAPPIHQERLVGISREAS